jgi:adenylate cyclase
MSGGLKLRIFDTTGQIFADDFSGPIELGRQDKGEQGPFTRSTDRNRDCARLVIAPHTEDSVSRQHALLTAVGDSSVRIENVSKQVPIPVSEDGLVLKPGESKEFTLPWVISLGRKTIRILANSEEHKNLQSLGSVTSPPGSTLGNLPPRFHSLNLSAPGGGTAGMSPQDIVHWLKTILELLQSATGTSEFLDRAAQAVVELVGLDSGRTILYENDQWKPVSIRTATRIPVDQVAPASRLVLRRVLEERRTLFEKPDVNLTDGRSLDRISAVVAAPILNRAGEVIGVLYGDRDIASTTTKISGPITEPEAMLVEALASGVATGMERMKQEKKAVETQVLFEQFFTPELAQALTVNPNMLESRKSDVTLLFCDIRGFSRISEQLGPKETMDWINDVMGALSDCVRAHEGVLVNYIGDELMAMWGAPREEPNHALLACRAAVDMLDVVPVLNERWKHIIDKGFDLGIGLNSGPAQVGNTGTKRKFQYGPLGNIASRLQGASKYFKTRVLISGETYNQLAGQLPARKLSTIRVINIDNPVDIYELGGHNQPNWETLKKGYEQALEAFENENFAQATRTLGILQLEIPNDGPSLILLSRVVNAKLEPSTFSKVWTLPSK